MQQNQVGFRLEHPASAVLRSLQWNPNAEDLSNRRALAVMKGFLPWIETIEWEAAACSDSDCEDEVEGDEIDGFDDAEGGIEDASPYDRGGGGAGKDSADASEGEDEDSIPDEEAAASLEKFCTDEARQEVFPPADGAGMFPLVCSMNHSCRPNVSHNRLRDMRGNRDNANGCFV